MRLLRAALLFANIGRFSHTLAERKVCIRPRRTKLSAGIVYCSMEVREKEHPERSAPQSRISSFRSQLKSRDFRISLALSSLAFLGSLVTVFYASKYADNRASNAVTDIALSNVPVFAVDDFFVYGTFAFMLFVIVLFLDHPRRMPFMLYSLSIFYFTRALFVSLTHLGQFPTRTEIEFGPTITRLFFGADLFFSGHVGTPFLLALLFWKEVRIRAAFLAWTIFFSAIVLLGHLHYSIDVLSALFIAYAIRDIACRLFPGEHALFVSEGNA